MRFPGTRLLLLLLFVLLSPLGAARASDFAARDMSTWNDPKQTHVLTGPWDFYWKTWLKPEELERLPDYTLDGQSKWNNLLDKRKQNPFGPRGYGTYRLELTGLQPRKNGYELHFPFLSTAAHVFVFNKADPQQIVEASAGILGKTADSMVPQIKELVLGFYPKNPGETWVVLVQMSNFYHASGGMLTAPLLGMGPVLSERSNKEQLGYIFSTGVILVVCVYNVMLFYRRREDVSSLMLASFCLVAGLRTFANGNLVNLFLDADRSLPFLIKYVLEYSTLCLEPLAYAAFIHYSFRRSSWPWVLPAFVGVSVVGTLLTFVSLPITYGRFLGVYQLSIIVQSVFCLVVLSRAIRHQLEGAKLALGSGLVLAFTITYDILVSYNILPQPYIMQYGIDVFVFLQSQVVARRFATAFRTAERLQNELQIEVERQTQEIRSMMEHVPQGIFLVLADQTIQPNYSRHLEDILGRKKLAGLDVPSLLLDGRGISAEQKSIMDTILLSAFGEDLYAWEVNSWQLPREIAFFQNSGGDRRILEIDWHPVLGTAAVVERVLVTIRDVTHMRVLQAENLHRQVELDQLIELLGTAPGTLSRFFEHAEIHLERVRLQLQSVEEAEHIKRMAFIELHSLKGLSRSQGLRRLASLVHDTEQHYAKDQAFDRNKLQTDWEKVHGLLAEYKQIYQTKISREANQGAELHLERRHLIQLESMLQPMRGQLQLDKNALALMTSVQEFLGIYLYRTADHVLDELMHEVQKLAYELGKENPKVSLIGLDSFHILPQMEQMICTSFLHSVRNSLDHGIESADERTAKGKPAHGHIVLSCFDRNNRVEIVYEDDGQGLDIRRIEAKARAKGLWTEDRTMTIQEATEMLFQSGFSTKDKVSEISGRGVGMDAIRNAYREFGGDVQFNLEGIEDEESQVIPFRLWGYLPKNLVPLVNDLKKIS